MPRRKSPRFNSAEENFLLQWRGGQYACCMPVRNHRFHPLRKWELDFAWPTWRVGLEIQGGIWIGGAHARPTNILRDLEKHNALLDLGWAVWHFTPAQVMAGTAVQHLERVLMSIREGGGPWIPTILTVTGGKTTSALRVG